jgi:hypothetical protein
MMRAMVRPPMGGRVATRLQLLLKADECSGSDDGEVLQRGRYWNESSKSGYLKHENNFSYNSAWSVSPKWMKLQITAMKQKTEPSDRDFEPLSYKGLLRPSSTIEGISCK